MCATTVLNQYTLLWIEQLIEVSLTILEYYTISILSMISLHIAADVVTSLIGHYRFATLHNTLNNYFVYSNSCDVALDCFHAVVQSHRARNNNVMHCVHVQALNFTDH